MALTVDKCLLFHFSLYLTVPFAGCQLAGFWCLLSFLILVSPLGLIQDHCCSHLTAHTICLSCSPHAATLPLFLRFLCTHFFPHFLLNIFFFFLCLPHSLLYSFTVGCMASLQSNTICSKHMGPSPNKPGLIDLKDRLHTLCSFSSHADVHSSCGYPDILLHLSFCLTLLSFLRNSWTNLHLHKNDVLLSTIKPCFSSVSLMSGL